MKHTVYLSQINHLKFKIVFNFGVVNSYRIIAITNKKNCVTLKQLRQKKNSGNLDGDSHQLKPCTGSPHSIHRQFFVYSPNLETHLHVAQQLEEMNHWRTKDAHLSERSRSSLIGYHCGSCVSQPGELSIGSETAVMIVYYFFFTSIIIFARVVGADSGRR